jgi:hypothetical protein
MKVTIIDGVVVKRLSPIKGVPTYGDWLRFLLSVGAAYTYTDGTVDDEGNPIERIRPYDRYHVQESVLTPISETNARADIRCIGCGTAVQGLTMERIRIGGLVQFPQEEQISHSEKLIRYKVQPVSKLGMGCRACQARYDAVVAEEDRLNKLKSEINTLRGQIALAGQRHVTVKAAGRCKHGMDSRFCAACGVRYQQIKVPTVAERVPFLNVLEDWGGRDE